MITECPYCGYDGLEYTGIDDDAGDYAGQIADVYECINCGATVAIAADYDICAADDGVTDDDDDDSGQDWLFAAQTRAAAAAQRDMLDLEIGYQESLRKNDADNGEFDFPF